MLLKRGSKGKDVEKVQLFFGLNDDGDFTKITEDVVKKWQLANNCTVNGIINDDIWSKLFPINTNKDIFEKLKGNLPDTIIEQLKEVSKKYQIISPLRLAHFLSQCSHESANFKAVSENLNYSAEGLKKTFSKYFTIDLANKYAKNPEKIASRVYANRMGNSTEESKEGWKYRGRGYIQCTGKSLYQQLSKEFGVDFINNPDLLSEKYALLSAAWFFNKNGLWSICDKGSTNEVISQLTKRINGGQNGLNDRIDKFNKFFKILN